MLSTDTKPLHPNHFWKSDPGFRPSSAIAQRFGRGEKKGGGFQFVLHVFGFDASSVQSLRQRYGLPMRRDPSTWGEIQSQYDADVMNVHEKVTELRREIREMHEKMLEKQAEQLTMREIGFGQRFRSWQDHSEELNSWPSFSRSCSFLGVECGVG